MSQIFKVYNCNVKGNSISSVLVFVGYDSDEYQKRSGDDEILKKIFTEEQIVYINKNKIPIKFVNYYLNIDDTIKVIKYKIISALETKLSVEELYLFYESTTNISSIDVYNKIIKNQKSSGYNSIFTYLSNISGIDPTLIEKKDTYNYDDIIKLGIDKIDYTIDIPIGINNTDYTIYNPFKLMKYYSIFSALDFNEDDFENIVSQNNNILLDYKNISSNTIYLFTANNILTNLDDTFDKNLILKLYYPQLLEKNINTFDLYNSNNNTLITNTKQAISSKSFIKTNDNITMLYEIYNKKSSDLPYIINGISKIQLTIYPRVSFKFPLDIVFKLLQTSENLPLIKYNPGNRKEKLYRLYSDKIATNGNKIPYLNKAKVFKMQKNIARTKSVSCLIMADGNTEIICNFKEDGSINIEFSYFKIPVSVAKIDEYIKTYVNPIIEVIKNFLEQSGYTFILYNNINEPNIEINDLSYFTNIPVKRNIKISEYIGCLNDVFNVYKDVLSKEIILRYKRVSNLMKWIV